MIAIAAALVLIAGPLLLGLAGWLRARHEPAEALPSPAWDWRLTIASALLYVLAFNLTFFIQELFLVLPKALTPGLRPTLFHNNHRWEGANPLASLFQGTGVLAIVLSGAICALLLQRGRRNTNTLRLFLIWMTYCGFFQALPQVVIGAISPASDVGMAMDYLRLSATARMVAAFMALAAMPPIAFNLTHALLSLADDPRRIANAGARSRFIFFIATLPGCIAILLIILFRVPREFVEVFVLPTVVTLIGTAWMQAGAWRVDAVQARGSPGSPSIAYPLGAVLVLLCVFQVLLRPGIPFFQVH